MTAFWQKLIWLAVLIVVIFALNVAAQQFFPTKTGDDPGRRMAYRGLIYVMFFAVLGLAILIGLASSR